MRRVPAMRPAPVWTATTPYSHLYGRDSRAVNELITHGITKQPGRPHCWLHRPCVENAEKKAKSPVSSRLRCESTLWLKKVSTFKLNRFLGDRF